MKVRWVAVLVAFVVCPALGAAQTLTGRIWEEGSAAPNCPAVDADSPVGVLSSQVTDSEGGAPIPEVDVRLRMSARRSSRLARARTDALGQDRFCGVPSGQPVAVFAEDGDRRSDETVVTLGTRGFTRVDLSLGGGEG